VAAQQKNMPVLSEGEDGCCGEGVNVQPQPAMHCMLGQEGCVIIMSDALLRQATSNGEGLGGLVQGLGARVSAAGPRQALQAYSLCGQEPRPPAYFTDNILLSHHHITGNLKPPLPPLGLGPLLLCLRSPPTWPAPQDSSQGNSCSSPC
jgi:hypothetical protein